MKFMKGIINKKINNITLEELLKYSAEYQVPITPEQGVKIIQILKGYKIDIYNDTQRVEILKKVAQVTNPATAKKLNELFQNLT